MKRFATLTILAALVFPVSGITKNKKIRGYVTEVISPTSFEIEDYRITRDLTLTLDFEKDEDSHNLEFRPEDFRVGTEVEIFGEFDETSGELRAKSIKIFLEDNRRVKRTALIERPLELERAGDGWVGTILADGQRVRVGPATKMLFRPSPSEKEAEKARRKGRAQDDTDDVRPLASLSEVSPNTFVSYEGMRLPDGTIEAVKAEFMRNELEKGEAKMWKNLTPKRKEPDYNQLRPGEVRISKVGKFKLLPSDAAQKYVGALGERLIPAHQKSLPAGNPNKVPFSFHLVQGRAANAFALPNGTIVIFAPMFEILENEAQLATVIGHEIAHSVQEHSWRQMQYHKKKLFAMRLGSAIAAGFGAYSVSDVVDMVEGAIRNGYSRSLENQADRLGLEYMLSAGYDPREAPRVWKLMAKKYGDQPTNFFWSSHDNHTTRRSYLMAELRNNYASMKFDQSQRDGEFQRMAEAVRAASKARQKVKVKY